MAPQLEPPGPMSHWPVGRLEVEGAEGMAWWGKPGMGLLWLMFIHQGRAAQPRLLGWAAQKAGAAAEITACETCLP